jgi:N-acetyl-beta-hexosaminidase
MALQANLETAAGESRDLYIRINDFEGLNNHGSFCSVRLRGFISQAAYAAGKAFVWERQIEVTPDITQNVWTQGYAAAKARLLDTENPLDASLTGPVLDV